MGTIYKDYTDKPLADLRGGGALRYSVPKWLLFLN